MVFAIAAGVCGATRAGDKKPMVLFNHDAGAGSLTEAEPPITQKQVCRQLDELEGTSVGVFLFCCNIGGDMFLYPSKVGETCGAFKIADWNILHPKYRNEIRRTTQNLKHLSQAGLDPIEIIQRRARQLGIRFWISFRMNDIHEDDIRWGGLRSQYKLANRHLLIEKDYPQDGMGAIYASKFGYSYAWDYGREETRRHILAVLAEMLDKYELDGLELDFMRHPIFFKCGQEIKGATLMTDFVRKVRAEVDRVAKAKDREITFAVRVYPTLVRCEKAGLDVQTWIKDGLIDLVTPMDPGYMDMQPSLREFVAAANGTKVKIAGGLENISRDYGPLSKAQAYAAASAFLEQGADAIYFFNYDCHRHKGRTQPYTSEEIEILNNIGQPQKFARSDKHYFVTRDTSLKTPEDGGSGQLPSVLTPGKPRQFSFTLGDKLQSAHHNAILTVTFKDYDAKNNRLTLLLNDIASEKGDLSVAGQVIRWQKPPIRQGNNVLDITVSGSEDVLVEKIEIAISYPSRCIHYNL
ncbi:MAG: hypothetical protein JXM70_28530 [Pirellulales bacterium]|nr:hypothetical protein [Pirellulales bacterium]